VLNGIAKRPLSCESNVHLLGCDRYGKNKN